MESNYKKNNLALIIGFLSIFVIALLTFIRPALKKDKTVEKQITSETNENDNNKMISSDELFNMMNNQSNIYIIDIRSQQEFNKEHIIDSKNIVAQELPAAIPSLNKDKLYILVSNSFSKTDIEYLNEIFSKNNIENYFYLSDGFIGWKNKYQLIISEGDPSSFVDQSKVSYISVDELKKELENDESKLLIIDLRKNSSYKGGHIKNSLNIYLEDIENQYEKITPGKKIILYDKDGLWSFKGAVRLNDLGIYNVFSLTGGLDEWMKKGYETIK